MTVLGGRSTTIYTNPACATGKTCGGPNVLVRVESAAAEKCELKWAGNPVPLNAGALNEKDQFVSQTEVWPEEWKPDPNATYVPYPTFDALVSAIDSLGATVTCEPVSVK